MSPTFFSFSGYQYEPTVGTRHGAIQVREYFVKLLHRISAGIKRNTIKQAIYNESVLASRLYIQAGGKDRSPQTCAKHTPSHPGMTRLQLMPPMSRAATPTSSPSAPASSATPAATWSPSLDGTPIADSISWCHCSMITATARIRCRHRRSREGNLHDRHRQNHNLRLHRAPKDGAWQLKTSGDLRRRPRIPLVILHGYHTRQHCPASRGRRGRKHQIWQHCT